jgi:hypothetical protein
VSGVRTAHPDSGRLNLGRSVQARRTALSLPEDMSLEAWTSVGQRLFVIVDASSWWIGDWLIFGRGHYPDRYRRAVEETSLSYQTLRNYAWVAARFEVPRRREKLPFQHHVEVATLPDEDQDYWLGQAEQQGWSRNELRARLRARRAAVTDEGAHRADSRLALAVPVMRLERWERAAASAGSSLLDWMISILDHACDQLSEQPIGRLAPSAIRAE